MRRASIGSAARLVFMRDMTLAWRRWDEVAQPLIFYLVVTTLFPLATTPDLQQLRRMARAMARRWRWPPDRRVPASPR